MLLDARTVQPGSLLHADVAVVGGGLCGLTLARTLAANNRLRIVVLESGGQTPHAELDELNRGTASIRDAYSNVRVLDDYLHESRCRRLGGSGHLWGGKCAELDPIDFEMRHWIDHSGWPFDYEHLKPYVDRACQVVELPVFRRHAPVEEGQDRAPLLINRERTITTGLRRHSAIAGRAPQNHFERFLAHSVGLPNVAVYLYATVVDLPVDGLKQVPELKVRTSHDTHFSVRARACVLAAGGLENARLLLVTRHGNAHDLVGRYFMGHVAWRRTRCDGAPSRFVPRIESARLALYTDKDPTQLQGVLQLTRSAQKRERLPNCSLTIEPTESPQEALPVFFMLEQRPCPQSRLMLTAERDAMGLPRLHLDWRFQQQDFLDLRRAAALFADELRRHGIGELHYELDERALIHHAETARHHMGTTRMHAQPQQGVVNEHCRVHGLANLFVAGTSVFPTSGISNPTLATLALTLRLAEHLQEQVLATRTG